MFMKTLPCPTVLNLMYGFQNGFLYRTWFMQGKKNRHRKSKPILSLGYSGYRVVSVNGVQTLQHRVIYTMFHGPIPEGLQIDHIDGNKLNNHPENLRAVQPRQNAENQKISKNNTSGCTGVHYDRFRGKWKAVIMKNRKSIQLGRFNKLEDAITARKAKERELGWLSRGGT